MYTVPRRPKEKEKVRLSFSNWVLGGSLVKPERSEEHVRRRSSGSKRVALVASPGDGDVKVTRRVAASSATKAPNEPKAEDQKVEEKKSDDKPVDNKATEEKKDDEKSGEVKAKDKKKSKDKKDDTKKEGEKAGKPEFTAEQDAEIVKLQKEGKTWREIAKTVKRGQKDCQARFEELEKRKSEGENEKTDTPALAAEEKKEENNVKNKKTENKDNKKKKVEKEETGGKRLEADDIWTKDDCKTLEMLEERYREQKWLQIQASFYNFTGRMVVADIIEKKFQEG